MSTPSPTDAVKSNLLSPSLLASAGGSRNASDTSLHRVKNLPGYTTPVFKGKEEQRALVENDVAAKVSRTSPLTDKLAD